MVHDLGVLIAPGKTYQRLADAEGTTGWSAVFQRSAVIALLLGTGISLISTGNATLSTVASTTLYWSVVPLVQVAGALLVVLSTRKRRVSLARGVELMLVGHMPWTLFVLTVTALSTAGVRLLILALAAGLVASLWRAVIITGLCKAALETGARGAVTRAILHQGGMWLIIFVYASWAVALTARF